MASDPWKDSHLIFAYTTATHFYELHWTSIGDPNAPPLVFVHGTPWSSVVWIPYALSLASKFHVYLFDNPGFGSSPLGEPLAPKLDIITDDIALDADLAQQSEAFAALFKYWERDWQGKKAHVIAHDHGGLMTLRANILHGCKYASLCLIDVVTKGYDMPLFKLIAANKEVFKQLTGPIFEGVVESYIRDAAHVLLSKETMEMLKKPWISNEEGRHGFIRQMIQASRRSAKEVEHRYAEVGQNIPVLVIWGKEDKWIPVADAYMVKDKVKAKDVVVIEGAGHLIMYDQEARLGVELGWWLSSVSSTNS